MTAFEEEINKISNLEISDQQEKIDTSSDQVIVTYSDRYKKREKYLFLGIDEVDLDAERIAKQQNRDYKFFLKFRKYYPIAHFVDSPERSAHTYEKQFWTLTFFDRVSVLFKKCFSPLSSSPFSLSGDCVCFEQETLYYPQTCPAYKARSRKAAEIQLKNFDRVMAVINSDVFEDNLSDHIRDEDNVIFLGKFLRKSRKPRFVDAEETVPTTSIDRHAIPIMIREK